MNIKEPNLPYLLMGYSVVMGIREMFTNWRRVMISIAITTEYFITEKERTDSEIFLRGLICLFSLDGFVIILISKNYMTACHAHFHFILFFFVATICFPILFL